MDNHTPLTWTITISEPLKVFLPDVASILGRLVVLETSRSKRQVRQASILQATITLNKERIRRKVDIVRALVYFVYFVGLKQSQANWESTLH